MKSLIRKRNGGNPGRLTRVLSQKSLNVSNNSPAPKSPPRTFLLETPVQFTTVSKNIRYFLSDILIIQINRSLLPYFQGVQSQDRHLFLFSDLLLIAKARNGGNFKLKQSVRMSELWLTAGHIEDVAETSKSQETSFVLGWPTTNVVATFMYVTISLHSSVSPFFFFIPPFVNGRDFASWRKESCFFFLETRNKLANSSKCVKGGKEIHRSIKTVEVSVLSGRITPIFISFRTAAARDLWWGRLTELVREESMKEPPDTNIQVVYHDSDTNTEYVSAAYSSPSLRGIYRRYTHDDVQSKRRERDASGGHAFTVHSSHTSSPGPRE